MVCTTCIDVFHVYKVFMPTFMAIYSIYIIYREHDLDYVRQLIDCIEVLVYLYIWIVICVLLSNQEYICVKSFIIMILNVKPNGCQIMRVQGNHQSVSVTIASLLWGSALLCTAFGEPSPSESLRKC